MVKKAASHDFNETLFGRIVSTLSLSISGMNKIM